MPELPEVETVVRSLRPRLLGQRITRTWSSGHSLRQPVQPAALRTLHGAEIEAIERCGKYLLFRFANQRTLLSHLGMTGRYLIVPPGAPIEPHTHLRFSLASADAELRYVDPRRFGLAVVRDSAHLPELDELGPDPLGPAFTAAHLHGAVSASASQLKVLLLDQSRVAGLGNIYVNEALFLAGVRPTRPGNRLTRPAAARLHQAIVVVLQGAVDRRGTTLSDGGYIDAEGQTGDNQNYLNVYFRHGQPCNRCGTPILRIVQGQRSSFYCPTCQK